ncbi:MAG TPA: GNAT family N-acetyltransferase [Chlamydiales bacterium]|nr:GNAT family N-acetyltransferase [Chlamydiales bacterium]
MDNTFIFRRAEQKDLLDIIRLLSEDELGMNRELFDYNHIQPCYQRAFDEINSDSNQFLMVLEKDAKIVGTCHLTCMPSLTFQGSKRMNIEAVRVDQTLRNQKIGNYMLQQSIQMARKNLCKIVQLTTNKKRLAAKKFYEKIGFEATHEGMKLYLQADE